MNIFKELFYTGKFYLSGIFSGPQYRRFGDVPHNNPLRTPADDIIHHLAETFFKNAKAPGLAAGTLQNGQQRFYMYGYADKATMQPFTEHTVLEAGSVTKTLVANILYQLAQEGGISPDDSICRWLPQPAAANKALQHIQLKHLASHTSGLPGLPANFAKAPGFSMQQPYQYYDKEHLYAWLAARKFRKTGGYLYSNLGFGLLGALLDNSSGRTLEQLMRQYIWQPLQMTESGFTAPVALPAATGYLNGKPAPFWQFDCLAGAGALKTTTADMLRYLQAHTAATGHSGFNNAIAAITQKVTVVSRDIDTGSGWHISSGMQRPLYWHNGGTYGFSTFAAFEPHSQTAVFMAANAFNQNRRLDAMGMDLGMYLAQ